MSEVPHPFSFRTRQLRPLEAMVVEWFNGVGTPLKLAGLTRPRGGRANFQQKIMRD